MGSKGESLFIEENHYQSTISFEYFSILGQVIVTACKLCGKEWTFNNILDVDVAIEAVKE